MKKNLILKLFCLIFLINNDFELNTKIKIFNSNRKIKLKLKNKNIIKKN